MKICYVGNVDPNTGKFVKYFRDKNHEVHLITWSSGGWEGVKVHHLGGKHPWFNKRFIPLTVLRFRKLINQIRPDILHTHYLFPNSLYGALSGFHPHIAAAWGSDVLIVPKENFIYKKIIEFSLKKADIIESVSENLTEKLIPLCGDKEKIITVPLGVNTEIFNPNINGFEIRKSLNWENNPIIISVRNFEPIYNIECLINAIPLVIKEVHDAKFILAGKGTLENELKNMVKELGISNSVKFIDYVQNEELPEYLAAADVYVSTSLSDGTSISLLEAMSCGLPIVVTNIDGNKPWIKNGKNGYLFEKKDFNALAEYIVSLIKNKEKLKIFGEKNREIVKERGNLTKNMEKIEELYINLIKDYGH